MYEHMFNKDRSTKISEIDIYLDDKVGLFYKNQPLAQDWARVTKIGEELGEAINELILSTGQNPRKGFVPEASGKMLSEIADVVWTGVFGIQHFVKDIRVTENIIDSRLNYIYHRMTHDL